MAVVASFPWTEAHESEQKLYAPAWADPDDAPDLSTPEWADKLAVTPVRRGRRQAAKRKVSTTIRLDADIVAAFREQGEGWQTRLNAALRDWLDHH